MKAPSILPCLLAAALAGCASAEEPSAAVRVFENLARASDVRCLGRDGKRVQLVCNVSMPSEDATETISLYLGPDNGHLRPVEERHVKESGPQAFLFVSSRDFGEREYYRLLCTTQRPGEDPTGLWEPLEETGDNWILIEDSTAYLWAPGSGERPWSDPSSWSPSNGFAAFGSPGFPGRPGSLAVFPAGASEVLFDRDAEIGAARLEAGAAVRFRGTNPCVRVSAQPPALDATAELALEGLEFSVPRLALVEGGSLRLSDGAVLCIPGGALEAYGLRPALRFGPGTSARLGELSLCGTGTELVIDDARVRVEGDLQASFVSAPGCTTVFRGRAPSLTVESGACGADGGQRAFFRFVVPEGGYAEAPVQGGAANTNLFGRIGKSAAPPAAVVIDIDPASPALASDAALEIPLVAWPAGFDPERVMVVPPAGPGNFFHFESSAAGVPCLFLHVAERAASFIPEPAAPAESAAPAPTADSNTEPAPTVEPEPNAEPNAEPVDEPAPTADAATEPAQDEAAPDTEPATAPDTEPAGEPAPTDAPGPSIDSGIFDEMDMEADLPSFDSTPEPPNTVPEEGSAEDSSADSAPVEPAPVEPTPVEPAPDMTEPAEAEPAEPAPLGTEAAEDVPADTSDAEMPLAPVEPAPVEPAPVEPAPVEPAPVEPAPVEPAPVEPAPVEPAPVDGTNAVATVEIELTPDLSASTNAVPFAPLADDLSDPSAVTTTEGVGEVLVEVPDDDEHANRPIPTGPTPAESFGAAGSVTPGVPFNPDDEEDLSF